MGGSSSLCQAVTTPDVFIKLGTAEQQLQKFLLLYSDIKKILDEKAYLRGKFNKHKYQARKYVQGIYIGPVNSKKIPETDKQSTGIFLYQAGFLYQGQMKEGVRAGLGRLINEEGQFYEGEWFSNNPQGKGIYVATSTRRKYEGEWKGGLQEGKGIQIYQDGSRYEGNFVKGQKHGKGTLQYPDNTKYVGEFKNNKISGVGVSSGKFHKYEGEWSEGKMHGNGVSTWNNQKGQVIGLYIGQYLNGVKHGFGQYKWGQKKIYKGVWQQGDMKSEGILLNYQA